MHSVLSYRCSLAYLAFSSLPNMVFNARIELGSPIPRMQVGHEALSVCMCVLSSHLFWTSDLWTHQPGSHRRKVTGFYHLPSAVLALIFIASGIQPPLSLVDRKVEFCVPTFMVLHFLDISFFFRGGGRKNPSSCECAEIRTHVPTSEGFEVTN